MPGTTEKKVHPHPLPPFCSTRLKRNRLRPEKCRFAYNQPMTSWKTKLIHPENHAPEGYESLADPTWRGSTTLFPDAAAVTDNWDQYEAGYTYGLYGTPTTLEWPRVRALGEWLPHRSSRRAARSAISLVEPRLHVPGDHILIPESIYGPNRKWLRTLLSRFGVGSTVFTSRPSATEFARTSRPTRGWCGARVQAPSPWKCRMFPRSPRRRMPTGALVAIDNTWAAGVLFDALAHGADITLQALTKYVGGHSDLLLGSVTVRDEAGWKKVGAAQQVLGFAASPDDCSLALRGLKTLAVRLKEIESAALQIAELARRSA